MKLNSNSSAIQTDTSLTEMCAMDNWTVVMNQTKPIVLTSVIQISKYVRNVQAEHRSRAEMSRWRIRRSCTPRDGSFGTPYLKDVRVEKRHAFCYFLLLSVKVKSCGVFKVSLKTVDCFADGSVNQKHKKRHWPYLANHMLAISITFFKHRVPNSFLRVSGFPRLC